MICFHAQSQVIVSDNLSPEAVVNEVLAGPGITPSNITFNQNTGDLLNTQIGTFSGGTSSIGIENGIVIATGQIAVAEGPNDLPSAFVTLPEGEELSVEPDLEQIIGPVAIRDVAKLEFDFIARGDTLKFRFVFASEEYNEYTCSSYNDAFGFFISGPGIVGNPSYENSAKNIALLPGTSVPIGINTVNQGFAGSSGANSVCNATSPGWQANAIYFVDNESNGDLNTTQFDGFTIPFTVKVPVVCGETYHIKLAIADAVDRKNDSAVFIEAESFTSVPPLEASLGIINPEGENSALEGCSTYELNLSRPDASRLTPVYVRTVGLANADALLENLPDSIVFQIGETEKIVSIPVLNDGVHSGSRNFGFELLQPATCELDTSLIVLNAFINDRTALIVNHPDTIWVPCDADGVLPIVPEGGNPPYSIVWGQAELQGFNPTYSHGNSLNVNAIVSDDCDIHQVPIALYVHKETYPPVQIALPDIVQFDCSKPFALDPLVSGGSGDYSYSWIMDGIELSDEYNFNTLLPSPGTLIFSVSDRCNGITQASVEAVLFENPLTVSLGEDLNGNCDASVLILPEVFGGFGEIEYEWFQNQQPVHSEPVYSFVPNRTVSVRLRVSDSCGQSDMDTLNIFVQNPEIQIDMPSDTVVCAGDRFYLKPGVSGGLEPYTYDWIETGGTLPFVSFILDNDREFTLKVSDVCKEEAVGSVRVRVEDVIASIEMDYEREGRPLRNHSTPNCAYEWILPDGSISYEFEPVFNPVQGQGNQVFLTVSNALGCTDETLVFYDPPIRIFIPNAFTPDGDGLNDVFKAEGQYIESFEMSVFDRWGNLVFYTDHISEGWNGEGASDQNYAAANDIFTYKYTATTWSGEVVQGTGKVNLLR
jgi:gliding motility-associated-like protein